MDTVTMQFMDKNIEELDKLRATLKAKVSKRVAKSRETMTYSQPEVLEELKKYGLDRTQGSLSQIERGNRLPSVEMLYVLAKYLNTSTDFILGLTENELSATDIEEELATAKGEGKIDRLMHHLSKEQRQQVISYAEYLLVQSGHAQAVASSNEAGFEAGLSAYQRKHGAEATEDLVSLLTNSFPDLASIIDPISPTEHKSIKKS